MFPFGQIDAAPWAQAQVSTAGALGTLPAGNITKRQGQFTVIKVGTGNVVIRMQESGTYNIVGSIQAALPGFVSFNQATPTDIIVEVADSTGTATDTLQFSFFAWAVPAGG